MQELPASAVASTESPSTADPQEAQIRVNGRSASLALFLRRCAASLDCDTRATSNLPALTRAQKVFLNGGLEALFADARSLWHQIGVAPPPDRESRTALYRQVAALADELLRNHAIDNFFLMHKPPGLRLRFQARADVSAVAERVRTAAAGWPDGLVRTIEPGVYEPEYRLFGGPLSMRFAHQVFTADSLAWLDFHTTAPADTGPDWAVSLAMAQALLDALAIAGWEDIDVWDRIRERTGRLLPPGAAELPEVSAVAHEIVTCWQSPELLNRQLGPVGRRIVDEYRAAVEPIGQQWRADYFTTDAAYLGPRSVAAFLIIFHWNRSAMPLLRQALLAQALATREAALR